jgi:ABC-type glutathione transport system ATPase component
LAASIVVNFPDVGTPVAAYGLVMGVHELQPAVVPGSTAVGAPLIHLEDVARRYRVGEREVVALADVSFDVYAEEFVVVLGPSGSGKTTLGDLLERVVDVQARHVGGALDQARELAPGAPGRDGLERERSEHGDERDGVDPEVAVDDDSARDLDRQLGRDPYSDRIVGRISRDGAPAGDLDAGPIP